MKPGYDEQGRRNNLWAAATDTDRARRIALMYRARLRALDRNACDEADQTAAHYGETWMLEHENVIRPGQELTTAQAAELAQVPVERIRKWACANHPEKPGEPLLPRFKRQGRERTYLAEHVLAAAAAMRRYRHAHGGT